MSEQKTLPVIADMLSGIHEADKTQIAESLAIKCPSCRTRSLAGYANYLVEAYGYIPAMEAILQPIADDANALVDALRPMRMHDHEDFVCPDCHRHICLPDIN